MHKISNRLWRGLGAAALFSIAGGAAAAAHTYVPFSRINPAGNQWTGMWLADTGNLGDPPIQLTNQVLDGAVSFGTGNVAVLNDWTINATTHEATNVKAQLVVYGVAGHLYSADLHAIAPVQQFSNGNYGELCTLTALDDRPYTAVRSYVQAVVEPVGSTNTCASGLGTQTWLIPANATAATAPMVEPGNWSVLGAFTNPTTGAFVRWILWTGNEVVSATANFASQSPLLVGPPAGPAPSLIGRLDGNAILLSTSDDGTTHTDTFYHLSMTGSGFMSSLSYADTSPCVGNASFTAVPDSAAGVMVISDLTNSGYGLYTAPYAGGAVTQVYADSSGVTCGVLAGDTTSLGHAAVDLQNLVTGASTVIGVNETGPVTQTPVPLAGSTTVAAAALYTINGHFWILQDDFSTSPDVLSTLVVDGDGTVVQDYVNTRIRNDIWGGFFPSGMSPSVERDVVYLYGSPVAGSCSGGSLTAINTASFAATSISGLPADACSAAGYGWQPATVGYISEPAGSSPVEVDPVAGKMYILLGPDSAGLFENLASLAGFPFY